jgi:diaminohydroxyphosphoribosylaminopyrimidine deaminase/5-amino-6-(5-phosphoribosylamino)uracil reductase
MSFFLAQAFDRAHQIDPHQTTPNPRVGCIITDTAGNILSSDVHSFCGGPHAEAAALHNLAAQKNPNWDKKNTTALFEIQPLLKDKIVYITLEPCDCFKQKKTPSCTDLLIHHQARQIIIGAIDPIFAGKNIQKIRSAGIAVEYEKSFESRHKKINPFFPARNKPYICLKLAMTLNGKINLDTDKYSDDKAYISGKSSRHFVQKLRAEYSGILTTTQTVLNDDPRLTCRLDSFERDFSDPDIVIIGDRTIPADANIFTIESERNIYQIPKRPLGDILSHCRNKLQLDSLLVEAGSDVSTQLLQKNLVDEICFFVCPLIAKQGLQSFVEEISLENFKQTDIKSLENDIMIRFQKR